MENKTGKYFKYAVGVYAGAFGEGYGEVNFKIY
jgi:hypothetical protein